MVNDHVLVVGAGSWGTALADLLARKGADTTIWAREREVVAAINTARENPVFLPGVRLSESLRATSELEDALGRAGVIVNAVPTQFIRPTYARVAAQMQAGKLLVSVSKGIEVSTLLTPSEIFGEVVGGEAAAGLTTVSGPSFAREVAAEHPTAVVAASKVAANAYRIRDLFATPRFRVYSSDDVRSVELGGALKNVVAIAAGMVEGLRYGSNSAAALISRGLAEIMRLGVARGGDPLTFAGLSGMGDLVLTCTGALSRNRTVGVQLGQGKSLESIVAEMNMVAEGVKTTDAAHTLAQREGVSMPITAQVHAVLSEGRDPAAALDELMTRPLRDERDS